MLKMDSDYALALQLQEEFDKETSESNKNLKNVEKFIDPKKANNNLLWKVSLEFKLYGAFTVTDSQWELIDPNPNIQELFVQFDKMFFRSSLGCCEVKWSKTMYRCAGITRYQGFGGLCSIGLSLPLLKLRPRKDLVQTLLHEMIHAYLFVAAFNRDRDDHGPDFQSHMHRINKLTGSNITIYHTFNEEVSHYQRHWWRCNGPCQRMSPFYGYVKRSVNRAPGPNDFWWNSHKAKCNGNFIKIKEPENFKSRKKKNSSNQTNSNGEYFKSNNAHTSNSLSTITNSNPTTSQILHTSAEASGKLLGTSNKENLPSSISQYDRKHVSQLRLDKFLKSSTTTNIVSSNETSLLHTTPSTSTNHSKRSSVILKGSQNNTTSSLGKTFENIGKNTSKRKSTTNIKDKKKKFISDLLNDDLDDTPIIIEDIRSNDSNIQEEKINNNDDNSINEILNDNNDNSGYIDFLADDDDDFDMIIPIEMATVDESDGNNKTIIIGDSPLESSEGTNYVNWFEDDHDDDDFLSLPDVTELKPMRLKPTEENEINNIDDIIINNHDENSITMRDDSITNDYNQSISGGTFMTNHNINDNNNNYNSLHNHHNDKDGYYVDNRYLNFTALSKSVKDSNNDIPDGDNSCNKYGTTHIPLNSSDSQILVDRFKVAAQISPRKRDDPALLTTKLANSYQPPKKKFKGVNGGNDKNIHDSKSNVKNNSSTSFTANKIETIVSSAGISTKDLQEASTSGSHRIRIIKNGDSDGNTINIDNDDNNEELPLHTETSQVAKQPREIISDILIDDHLQCHPSWFHLKGSHRDGGNDNNGSAVWPVAKATNVNGSDDGAFRMNLRAMDTESFSAIDGSMTGVNSFPGVGRAIAADYFPTSAASSFTSPTLSMYEQMREARLRKFSNNHHINHNESTIFTPPTLSSSIPINTHHEMPESSFSSSSSAFHEKGAINSTTTITTIANSSSPSSTGKQLISKSLFSKRSRISLKRRCKFSHYNNDDDNKEEPLTKRRHHDGIVDVNNSDHMDDRDDSDEFML